MLKANKLLALAVSEATLGNEHAAQAAAYRAGVLAFVAHPAAILLDTSDALVWNYVVDGFYDAKETYAAQGAL